jgi:DNA end-binding protein Ku
MPAAARSFWKGHLRLALVVIPVRLVSATAADSGIHFHQVDRKSRQRVRYQKVAGESGEAVDSDDIVRGVEVEPGRYVLVEDEEIDALKLSTRHTIELLEFVDPLGIEPQYFERPYYVLPDGDVAEEGYRVIREALRATGRCGIGQLTMRGREHLVAVSAVGKGLQVTTLRYQSELKDAEDIFSPIREGPLRPELVTMATQLIEERSGEFDPAAFRDHYAEALDDLVATKARGGTVEVSGGDRDELKGTVIDFMEALRRSVAGKGEPPPEPEPRQKRSAPAKTRSAAAASRREPAKRTRSRAKK